MKIIGQEKKMLDYFKKNCTEENPIVYISDMSLSPILGCSDSTVKRYRMILKQFGVIDYKATFHNGRKTLAYWLTNETG